MPASKPKTNPLEYLLPYQDAWVRDDSRFKMGLMARQVGKDFSCAAEGITQIIAAELKEQKSDWLIAAPSERQSLESLEKWKEWAEAWQFRIVQQTQKRSSHPESLLKSATITFSNGSRVIAVPGRPDTVRGFSANVVLTEFAFFDEPDKTWRAILPSITNPLRGGLKKVRLITTPNGLGNKAHEIWTQHYNPDAEKGGGGEREKGRKGEGEVTPSPLPPFTPSSPPPSSTWSCHRVDIHEAVAAGLSVDVEELRSALNDPEGWAQEYELQFLDQATVLLPYEMIAPCENPEATETIDPAFWNASTLNAPTLFGGLDFGRKRDLTVLWTLEVIGGSFRMTREVLCLEKLSTPAQVELLRPRLQRLRRVCLDYTGPGTGLGDYLVTEFHEYDPAAHKFGRIELCKFTNDLKVDIFAKLRMAFEARTIGIPVSREIREDLHSMSRVALTGGGVTYRAPHSPGGHADRCTALALALRAAATGEGRFASAPVKLSGRNDLSGLRGQKGWAL